MVVSDVVEDSVAAWAVFFDYERLCSLGSADSRRAAAGVPGLRVTLAT